mgnify:CR=1 FL=1
MDGAAPPRRLDRRVGGQERPGGGGRPRGGKGARPHRPARGDGRSVAVLRAVDHGDSCIVETEVFPANGSHEALRPGPYTFANAVQSGDAQSAIEEGARLVAGGQRPDRSGFWIEPTVFADVTDGMDFVGLQNVGLMDPEIHALWKDTEKFTHRFIGIAVTSATVLLFGEAIWDPVALCARFDSPLLVLLSVFALAG